MPNVLKLQGCWVSHPVSSPFSGNPEIETPFDESMATVADTVGSYTLSTDGPQAVSLGGLSLVHAVFIKTCGGKVTATITSADGTSQSVPVDPLFQLFCYSVPITAITLTRNPGVVTLVNVFLAQHG